jgi:hypothetical protein
MRLFVLALAAAAAVVLAPAHVVRAADDGPLYVPHQESFSEWVARMEAFFDANPELKSMPGSGWKPFNRVKWFYEQRLSEDGTIPVDARWNAFLRKKELEGAPAKAAVNQWFSLGPANFAGRMLDLKFDPTDPNVLYAGAAAGGIWKSTNAGVSWAALDDELPTLAVGAIAVVPSDPNIIVIGTGEATNNIDAVYGVGILRTTDGGATWNPTNVTASVSGRNGFHAMEANPFTDVILACDLNGVWRSSDQGATWTQVRSGGEFTDVKWKPGSSTDCYVCRISIGTTGRMFKSTDGGVTWSGASAGTPSNLTWGKTRLSVTAANPDYVYALFADIQTNAFLGLYRTTDAGASWTARNTVDPGLGGQCWYNLTCLADPNDASRVFCGGTPLFRSANGGTTLTQIAGSVHVDHHAAVYRPGSDNNLFVGSDGGVWESTDDGTTWIDRNSGLVTYQFYDICVSPPDPLRAWGGTQDNGTDRWLNSTTWLNGLGADGMVCNGHPTNANIVYGEIQFGDHRKSTNGGSGGSWFGINNGITGNGAWVAPVEIDPTNGEHLYTQTSDGTFRTTDGGANWVNITADSYSDYSISPVNGNLVWGIAQTTVRYSTDDGATWNTTAPFGFPTGNGSRVLAHPTDSNSALATFGTYSVANRHVALTTDLGVTWTDVTGDFPSQPVNAVEIDPQNTNNWFIGTDMGVWISANGGVNWIPFETGFPNAVVADLELQDSGRKLRAGTHGRGMWEVDISAIGTGVGSPIAAGPSNLMFDPAWPNPAKAGMLLRYAARNTAPVSLSIYDVQGRLVTNLAEHAADGIIREVHWRTDGVPNGVYLALLRSGADEKSQKLYVVK